MPAWCGRDGFPLSWRHYCYGLRYLGRSHIREQLARAGAARMAAAETDDYKAWYHELEMMLTLIPEDPDGQQ